MTKILIKNARYLILSPLEVLENGSVLIVDDRIAQIGHSITVPEDLVDETIDATDKIIMPGLIDAHCHGGQAHMFMLDGFALMEIWNKLELFKDPPSWDDEDMVRYVWPAYAYMDKERTYWMEMLSMLNSIKHGVTTVCDAFMFPDMMAQAALDSGVRLDMAPQVMTSVRLQDADSPEEYLIKADEAISRWHGAANGRITCHVHPHAIYSCKEWFLRECVALAGKYGVGIATHMAESAGEVEGARRVWPEGEVRRAYNLGMMGPKSLFFHSCVLTDEEIALYAETGTGVAHCPLTNTNTVASVARLADLLEAGVKVGLGTDMANNDMFYAMKVAWGIHHANPIEKGRIAPWVPFELATLGSAQVLNNDEIGALEVGKKADIVTVDLNNNSRLVELAPEALVWMLVIKSAGCDVADVIVDGRILMRNKQLVHLDEQSIVSNARKLCEEFRLFYLDRVSKGLPLLERIHDHYKE